MTNTVLTLIII